MPVSCSVAAMKIRGVTVFKILIRVLVYWIKLSVFDGLQGNDGGHAEDFFRRSSPWKISRRSGEAHENLPVGVGIRKKPSELDGDIAAIQIREDENIGFAANLGLTDFDFRQSWFQGRIGLHFAIDSHIRTGFLSDVSG